MTRELYPVLYLTMKSSSIRMIQYLTCGTVHFKMEKLGNALTSSRRVEIFNKYLIV